MNGKNLSIANESTTLPGLTRVSRDKQEIRGHFYPRIFLVLPLSPRIIPCSLHPLPARPTQVAAHLSLCQKMSLTITTCFAGICCRRYQNDKYMSFDDETWTLSSPYQSADGRLGGQGNRRRLTNTRMNTSQKAPSSTRIWHI